MDLRFMKLGRGPGSTWFFVYSIPKDLRGHVRFMTKRGKPMDKITESLGTTDPEKARENRDQRIVYWNRQFRMLREGPSEDDIREEVIEIYRATLKAEAARFAETEARQRIGEYPSDEDIEHDLYLQYVEDLDDAIEAHAAAEIFDYCKRTGIHLDPRSTHYRKFGIEILKAKMVAGDYSIKLPLPDGRDLHARDLFLPPLPTFGPPIPVEPKPITPPPKKTIETFSQAFDAYIATELAGTSAASIADYRNRVKVFVDKYGDLPLAKITDHLAVEFLDQYLLGERKTSARTRNGYAGLFSAVFKCAIRRKRATSNPFAEQRIRAETKHYEPFDDREIVALLAGLKLEIRPAEHTTATAGAWATLIAAFTGARLEEIAQLRAEDIKQTDGIWHFDLCANGNGKTTAATRKAPLHSVLVDAGLLRYRDTLPKDGMLFPGLRARGSKAGKFGPAIGDWFADYRKRMGVDRPGLNFHSFRHTVGDRLHKAGVEERDIASLLGHEHGSITTSVYGHNGAGVRRLAEIVERIDYGGWRP
jgi:integrase